MPVPSTSLRPESRLLLGLASPPPPGLTPRPPLTSSGPASTSLGSGRAGTSAPRRQVWGVPCLEGGVAQARPSRAGLTDGVRLQKRREELVLRVQPAELVGLVELILAEAEARSQDGDAGACGLLQARLPLLLSCCRGGDEGIRKVTAHLTGCVQQWGDR